jgi:hypothetical protein
MHSYHRGSVHTSRSWHGRKSDDILAGGQNATHIRCARRRASSKVQGSKSLSYQL